MSNKQDVNEYIEKLKKRIAEIEKQSPVPAQELEPVLKEYVRVSQTAGLLTDARYRYFCFLCDCGRKQEAYSYGLSAYPVYRWIDRTAQVFSGYPMAILYRLALLTRKSMPSKCEAVCRTFLADYRESILENKQGADLLLVIYSIYHNILGAGRKYSQARMHTEEMLSLRGWFLSYADRKRTYSLLTSICCDDYDNSMARGDMDEAESSLNQAEAIVREGISEKKKRTEGEVRQDGAKESEFLIRELLIVLRKKLQYCQARLLKERSERVCREYQEIIHTITGGKGRQDTADRDKSWMDDLLYADYLLQEASGDPRERAACRSEMEALEPEKRSEFALSRWNQGTAEYELMLFLYHTDLFYKICDPYTISEKTWQTLYEDFLLDVEREEVLAYMKSRLPGEYGLILTKDAIYTRFLLAGGYKYRLNEIEKQEIRKDRDGAHLYIKRYGRDFENTHFPYPEESTQILERIIHFYRRQVDAFRIPPFPQSDDDLELMEDLFGKYRVGRI